MDKFTKITTILLLFCATTLAQQVTEEHLYTDFSRQEFPYAADPHVLEFKGNYYLYYTAPPLMDGAKKLKGWRIGIARSKDLQTWVKVGEIQPTEWYEYRGISTPFAMIKDDKIHLFYQTYGDDQLNVVLHAISEDGIEFEKDTNNPVFVAKGDYTTGSATFVDISDFNTRYKMFYSTRDPKTGEDFITVASAPIVTTMSHKEWMQDGDSAVLRPMYPWEGKSITSPSVIKKNKVYYMFYAGARHNGPQQIGVASSVDGIFWTRLSNKPFFTNGDVGKWNYNESGNPQILQASNGKTYLFFQGNSDMKSSYISYVEVGWTKDGPYLVE